MSDLTRREMLTIAAVGVCAGCLGSRAFAADAFAPDDKAPAGKTVAIGTLADYDKPGLYDKFIKPNKLVISRLDDRLVAMSAVCTHKRVTVKLGDNDNLRCPAHGSVFSAQGTVDKGPARTSLVRYGIAQAADGTITVDMTKQFEEKDWEKDGALVKIEAEKKKD